MVTGEAIKHGKKLSEDFISEHQERMEHYFGEGCHQLKTDEEIVDMICKFGFGETLFHTADIERIKLEKDFWKIKYLELISKNEDFAYSEVSE